MKFALPAWFTRSRLIAAGVAVLVILFGAFGAWYFGAGTHSMDFALRQKVSAQSALHFSFPERMDKKSVEELITSNQEVQGTWSWDDETLVFHPASPLKAGETYTFLLPRTAKTSDGGRLGRDLEFVFTVSGPPVVAAKIPGEGTQSIATDSRITILFDRPMIPLSQVQGEFAKDNNDVNPWSVTIDPPVEGRWRWLSTVAREFIPAKGLTRNTRYTVNVPAGIQSVAGDKTEKDFSWSFETIRPEIIGGSPWLATDAVGPSSTLSLTFNQEMDLQSAPSFIRLLLKPNVPPPRGSPMFGEELPSIATLNADPTGQMMPIKTVVYGKRDGKTDKTTLVVTPQSPLAFGTTYGLYAMPGIKATQGNLGMLSGSLLPFTTVGDLAVVETRKDYGLAVRFNNPINEKTIKNNVTIKPAIKDIEWSVYEWSDFREITANVELAPSTAYTITVGTGLKDAFGQSLKQPYTYTFTTPQIEPRAFIHSEGQFGIFERGKPPVYYLNGVNVSSLDVEFAKLTLEEFLNLRLNMQYSDSPLPLAESNMYKTFHLKAPQKLNEWSVTTFDVEKQAGQSLTPGIYALQMSAPEYIATWGDKQKIYEKQYFAITNLAVTLKYSGDQTLVWVTDMQTGNPVKGAKITVHSLNGKATRTGTTDAEGFFMTDMPVEEVTVNNEWQPEFWVTAQTENDIAFVGSNWFDGVQPYNFGFNSDFRSASAPKYHMDGYFYTERPIYKAGDTVFFKGIMRLRDWKGHYVMPTQQAIVNITDAEGNQVFNKMLPINGYGSFNGNFPIDAKASLGAYNVSVQLTPETDVGYNSLHHTFSVLAYRKPEYKVDIVTPSDDYFNGDTIEATINGAYYFGAPMSQSKVAWRAVTTDYYFNKFTDGWYSFALTDSWCWYECSRETAGIAEGQGTLDDAGMLKVKVPIKIDDKPLSQVISIEADITDTNNQVVSNRTSVYAHKANAYVGIRSTDYVVEPNSNAAFDVVTLKPDGSPMPSTNVQLQLYSRTWNSIRKKSVDGEYYYDNQPTDTFIRSSSVTTAEDGKASTSVKIPAGGEYRIVAVVKDNAGREAKSATSIYSWSSTYINWPRSNTDRMDIIADKPEYKPGETAVLLVKSPYQGKGVKALVTVEREGIISRRVIDVVSNAQSIEIPVTEEMIPNAYVSVVVIKPRAGETFNENGLDTGAPAFKIGYAKLSVDISSKRVGVDIKADKDRYGPGETVTVTINTTDALGKGIPAEVSLGTVDMSLLALSSFETPDLTRLFYSERGLGVYTSQMLSFLLERFKPGSKGGGGADPESRKRGVFMDTAYWNPSIVTDANGRATVSFKLPDNLTTWQLLGIAHTKGHQFGSFDTTILETKKVIVRPVRPRFAVQRDKISMGAIVHNFLSESHTFTVTLEGSGFTPKTASQQVTIEAGKEAKLTFPVSVAPGSSMTMNFKAMTDGAVDEIEESIPVYEFGTSQSVATTGITDNVAMEKVIAPTVKDASEGTVMIAVSPSLATYLPAAFNYLDSYPYACAEQVVSGFLPAIIMSRLAARGATDLYDEKELEKIVTTGLQRIYGFQRADGGFAYFPESRWSHPHLSSYVLYGLVLAQKAGFSVDQGVIDRTVSFLQQKLRSQNPEDFMTVAERTSVLFSLSEAGHTDISLLNNVSERMKELPLFAKAQLAIAYQNAGSNKAQTILKDILNHTMVDSRGTHFEEDGDDDYWGYMMNTTQRTTAIVLLSMLRIDPDNALIPNVTRYMLTSRKDGHWDTTQSTAYSLLAFEEYLGQTGELEGNFGAGVQVNGKDVLSWSVDKKSVLQRKEVILALNDLKRGEENDVKIGLNGNGRLYYDILLSYFFTGDHIDPAEEGVSIRREIKPLTGKSTALKVGENYVVTLTITTPQQRNYLAVESPVPAGMEVVDVSLETSQKGLLEDIDSSTGGDWWDPTYWKSGLWHFTHREVRDDRFFLFAEQLPAGVYQYNYIVRATTPGTFHQRPTRAFEMYFPEVFGQTEGTLVTIGE
jgi:alpha-2-macroglobulin